MISKVLSSIRSEFGLSVKVDPGGGANITAKHFAPPGDDSRPLPGDFAAAVDLVQSGAAAVVGYIPAGGAGIAGEGEKRLYSRDASGAAIASVYLKADGSIEIVGPVGSIMIAADGRIAGKNEAGEFSLEISGDFLANGAKLSIDGDVQTIDGKSLRVVAQALDTLQAAYDAHTHTAPAGGGPTSPPN